MMQGKKKATNVLYYAGIHFSLDFTRVRCPMIGCRPWWAEGEGELLRLNISSNTALCRSALYDFSDLVTAFYYGGAERKQNYRLVFISHIYDLNLKPVYGYRKMLTRTSGVALF